MNDKPSFSIQIQPNFSDIRHAYRLYRASMEPESYELRPVLGILSLVGGGFGLLIQFTTTPESLDSWNGWWIAFGLLALGALILLDAFTSIQMKRVFERNKEHYSSPYTAIFEEDQISFQDQKSNAQVKWNLFTTFVEGRDEFLLVYGKMLYYSIPKKAFQNDSEIAAFRDFVKGKVPTFKQKLKIFLDFKM